MADPIQTVPAAAEAPKRKRFMFVIEFAGTQNPNTLCPITRRQYRGRWVASNVKSRVPDDRFARMPDLPGHQIAFNADTGKVTISDPLNLKENRDLLREAQSVYGSMGWGDPEGDDDEELSVKSDDQYKLWVYWCRRWVDGGQAVVVRGDVPEMADIEKLPGRVEHNSFDQFGKREKYPDPNERPEYRKPRPEKRERIRKRRRAEGD